MTLFSYTKLVNHHFPDQIFTFPNSLPKPLGANQLPKNLFPNYYKLLLSDKNFSCACART